MSNDGTSLWFAEALLETGWAQGVRLKLRDGAIAGIETNVARASGEAGGAVALPGLVNVHSHAFQRAMAGLTERRGPSADDFWSWRELMYRFLDRGGAEEIEAISALAFAEMLEGGFTRVAEFHYLHNDERGDAYADPAEISAHIVNAARDTGIALTMLPVFYAHANFGGRPFVDGQRRFISNVDGFAKMVDACGRMVRDLPDANVGVAPHSLRAVTPEELRDLVAIAGDRPIHIHVAEQTREVDDCLIWSGKRPVEWLMENAPVDQRWCLIHATHVTPEETRAMAQSGAVVGLCPITEANLGDGVFPAVEYLEAGGAFGVGTDSNVLIDAGEELRTMEYAQRLTRRKRSVLAPTEGSTGGELFRHALAGGQRATQSEGGLKIGAPADIVSLDNASSLLAHRSGDAHLDSWVFAGGKRLVKGVWRRGRKVVQGGRHIAREAIEQRYTQALGRILA